MDRIEVETYPFGSGFDTPEEAIRHGEAYKPLARARADAKQLVGSQVVDGFWTDTDFVVRFSNGRFLHVYVQPALARNNFDWRILEATPAFPETEIRRVGASPVELSFQEAGTYVMDCSRMIVARRGKEFLQFWVNEMAFYLYTPKQLILSFSCVYRRDSKKNLLYVYEGD